MPANGSVDHRGSARRQVVWMLAITLAAAVLRFWALRSIPPGYHYDEAFEGLEAWKVLSRVRYHPIFFTGNFGVEPLFIYLTSLAFRLAEASPVVQRGVAAFWGTLTVPGVFLLARELRLVDGRLPRLFPLAGAASLAVLYPHVHFSRVGIEPVLVPLLFCLGFWALLWGLRTGRLGPCMAAAVLLGLGPYAYPAGRLLLPLAVALLVAALCLNVAWVRSRWRQWALALVVALAVCTPLMLHFARYPELLTLRSSQVAVGAGEQGGLFGNTLKTLAMFSFGGDTDPRNNLPGRPYLDWLGGVPFYVGVAAVAWRVLRRTRQGEADVRAVSAWEGSPERSVAGRRFAGVFLLLSLATMLLPTALSEYAPHYRRAIGASAPAALLAGVGLAYGADWASKLVRLARPGWGLAERLVPLLLVVPLLGGSAFLTARDYFVHWGDSPEVYYAYDEGLWEIGQYVNGLPAQELVYVSPRPATDTTLAFAWREGRLTRHFDGRSAFAARPYGGGDGQAATYVIIVHEDFRGGELLRALYPEATRVRVFLDRDGRTYAEAVRVPDTSALSRGPRTERLAAWEGVRLLGYDLDRAAYRPGDTVYLQLWWSAEARISQDWTVFTHILGPERPDGGAVWAGHDGRPGQGSVSTSTWQPGELILDEHQLILPEDMGAGTYPIEIGLYDGGTGQRAEVDVSPREGEQGAGASWVRADHVILGSVVVE